MNRANYIVFFKRKIIKNMAQVLEEQRSHPARQPLLALLFNPIIYCKIMCSLTKASRMVVLYKYHLTHFQTEKLEILVLFSLGPALFVSLFTLLALLVCTVLEKQSCALSESAPLIMYVVRQLSNVVSPSASGLQHPVAG